VMRYRCVAARKAEGFNVTDACRAAEVSRSAFYAWLERGEGPTDAEWDEARLINQIRDIHAASDGTYGEPRMTAELADSGWVLNPKRTARLMREEGLVGHRPRRRRSLTQTGEGAPPIRIWSAGRSNRSCSTPSGRATSPTSAPVKGGCIWPP
jgi:putative transposase